MGRMDRAGVATPEPLTQYWTKALEAAVAELTKKGITLQDTATTACSWRTSPRNSCPAATSPARVRSGSRSPSGNGGCRKGGRFLPDADAD